MSEIDVLQSQLALARSALQRAKTDAEALGAWPVSVVCGAALASVDSVPDRMAALRDEVLRELGCRLGMDDYVPASDASYWSVDNVHKHVVWLEQREHAVTQSVREERDALAAEVLALKHDVERLRKRTHEIAEEKDAEHAARARELGQLQARVDAAYAWANESLRAYRGQDRTLGDAPGMFREPYPWWQWASEHNRLAVLGLFERAAERDALAEKLAAAEALRRLGGGASE